MVSRRPLPEHVAEKFGHPVGCGSEWLARCPAHQDGTASLTLRNKDGQVLVNCQAGCATPDVLAAVGLTFADLFAPSSNGHRKPEPGATYDYRDERGELLFQVVRFPGKRFRQRRPDGRGGWAWTLGDTRRVLYRLPQLVAAANAGRRIFVVEGERDAASVEQAGELATCNPGGAGKWRDEYNDYFKGARVVVVADKDEPGRRHAEQVKTALEPVARSVRIVEAAQGKDATDHLGAGLTLDQLVPGEPPEPAASPSGTTDSPNGAALLDEVRAALTRYVAFPSQSAAVGVTLWTAHTHVVDVNDSSPRLALLSPEPESGKTRTLEVLDLLVPRPMHALNASTAAVFRSIESEKPTLLFDEVDAIFGRRTKDDSSEDLRGLLNSGHRRGVTIPRCVGKNQEVKRFPVYAALALAGLGDLPDTLMSRSIIIRMRRRAPGEHVEPFRRRVAEPSLNALRDRLAGWLDHARPSLADAWPKLPAGLTDRHEDGWEPLLAVADAAGGHWPETARNACIELCKVAEARKASLGLRLLADLRDVFGDAENLYTESVLDRLHKLDEAPWSDLHGKPLNARRLAAMLGKYEIGPAKVRQDGGDPKQGYRREDLWDVWLRYLATPSPQEAEQAEHPEQARSEQVTFVPDANPVPEQANFTDFAGDAYADPVPEQEDLPEQNPPPLTCGVPHVPHVPDYAGRGANLFGCDTCGEPVTPGPQSLANGWTTTCASCVQAEEAAKS